MVAGKNPATIFSFYTALTFPDSGCLDSDHAWFIELDRCDLFNCYRFIRNLQTLCL